MSGQAALEMPPVVVIDLADESDVEITECKLVVRHPSQSKKTGGEVLPRAMALAALRPKAAPKAKAKCQSQPQSGRPVPDDKWWHGWYEHSPKQQVSSGYRSPYSHSSDCSTTPMAFQVFKREPMDAGDRRPNLSGYAALRPSRQRHRRMGPYDRRQQELGNWTGPIDDNDQDYSPAPPFSDHLRTYENMTPPRHWYWPQGRR